MTVSSTMPPEVSKRVERVEVCLGRASMAEGVMVMRNSSARGPEILCWTMCETSKREALERVQRWDSGWDWPGYSRGMEKLAKGTIFAPREVWRS